MYKITPAGKSHQAAHMPATIDKATNERWIGLNNADK